MDRYGAPRLDLVNDSMKENDVLNVLTVLMGPLALGGGLDADAIVGCVNANGRLRVVDAPADCRPAESAVSWNREGPEGARGPRGRRGRRGAAGADGQDGAEGQAGLDGRDGQDGADGPMGPRGPAGPAGDGAGFDRSDFYERSAPGSDVACDDALDLLISCRCEAGGLGGQDAYGYATPFHTTEGEAPDHCHCTFPAEQANDPTAVAVCLERGDPACGGDAPADFGQVCDNECDSGTVLCDGSCDADPAPETLGEACDTGCYCRTTPFAGISLIGLEGEVGCDGQCGLQGGPIACLQVCSCALGGDAEGCAYECPCGAQVGGVACGGSCLTRADACDDACDREVPVFDAPVEAAP